MSPTSSPPAPRRPVRRGRAQRRLQRRRLTVVAVVVVALLVAGASLLDLWAAEPGDEVVVPPPGPPAAPSPPAVVEPPPPAPSPPEPAEASPVLSLPGDFPDSGPGTFTFAAGEGPVLGSQGTLRRFRVAVEDGVDEDVAAVAEFVTQTLAHPQGWTAGGTYRFQQVPESAGFEFTVYLATSQTTGQMCAAAGLYVLAPGFPAGGVSCRAGSQVIINLARWRQSVPHFVDAEVPLETYRQMVTNHEIGHALGYGHYGCPAAGESAPVMMQQSLQLDGCEANPWPYLDGVHHTGPPAP